MTLQWRVVSRLVRRFKRNKQWRLLHLLLVVTRKDMGYLNAHARASAAAMPKLRALWAARARDEEAIRNALQDEKIALVSRHEISSSGHSLAFADVTLRKDDRTIRLFEKCRHPGGCRSVEREMLLRNTIGTQALLAPELLGVSHDDGVIRSFYSFVEFDPPERDAPLFADVLVHFWQRGLSGSETRVLGDNTIDPMLASGGDIWRLLGRHSAFRTVPEIARERVRQRHAGLPLCLVNTDLTTGSTDNVVRANGQLIVVDWDKWIVGRVGYGLDLRFYCRQRQYFEHAISEGAKATGLSRDDVVLGAAVYTTYKSRHEHRLPPKVIDVMSEVLKL